MSNLPEPWLRGPIADVHPLITPVLYSFQHAREDLARHTEGLSHDQIWAGEGSVGFHIRHIAGSTDRLVTYLQGRQLSADQMTALATEKIPGSTREELLAMMDAGLHDAEAVVRAIDPTILCDRREVGRQRLPSTVIGLLIHIAEHTQRHVGQAIMAAKAARREQTGRK